MLPTGPPGADSATPFSSPCSTTPEPASPKWFGYMWPTCFSIARRPCSCTARDARSGSSRSGRAPQRSSGHGFPESIEAPTPPYSPIERASPCRAPESSTNCASPVERRRSIIPRSRRNGSRLTRYATRPRCICSSRESTSPSLPSGSATRTRPPPTSTFDADLAMKEAALQCVADPAPQPLRFTATDRLLDFLEAH